MVALQNWSMKPQVQYAEVEHVRGGLSHSERSACTRGIWGLHNNGTNGGRGGCGHRCAGGLGHIYRSRVGRGRRAGHGRRLQSPGSRGQHVGRILARSRATTSTTTTTAGSTTCTAVAPAVSSTNGDPIDRMLDVGHGTHVAGTVGAVGNNDIGVDGCQLERQDHGASTCCTMRPARRQVPTAVMIAGLSVRDDDEDGSMASMSSSATTATAAEYHSEARKAAIQAHIDAGILFVAAAGNDGTNNDVVARLSGQLRSAWHHLRGSQRLLRAEGRLLQLRGTNGRPVRAGRGDPEHRALVHYEPGPHDF